MSSGERCAIILKQVYIGGEYTLSIITTEQGEYYEKNAKAGDRCSAGGCGGRKRDHGSLCTEREHQETYAYLPEHSVYFYDTAGEYAWASREVDTLAVAGVIKGSGTHLFYPGNAITRADFIVMLDRAYGMSEALDNGQVNSNGSFVDVPSSAYYSKAVIAAKAFGIAAGTATGEFQPQQSMTRQDAMVFLKRTIDRTALKLGNGSVSSFSDASRISNYAKPSVSARGRC